MEGSWPREPGASSCGAVRWLFVQGQSKGMNEEGRARNQPQSPFRLELTQLRRPLGWKKLLSSLSMFMAVPREVCGKCGVSLPGVFQQCVGWLPSPSSGAAGKVPVGRAEGGGQRGGSTHPASRREGAGGPDCSPAQPRAGQPGRRVGCSFHRGPHHGRPDAPEGCPPWVPSSELKIWAPASKGAGGRREPMLGRGQTNGFPVVPLGRVCLERSASRESLGPPGRR